MFKKMLALAAVGTLLLRWSEAVDKRFALQQQLLTAAKPEPIAQWEGEGGALRVPAVTERVV